MSDTPISPPPDHLPTDPTPQAPQIRRPAPAVVVASIWLVVSLFAGLWLFTGTGPPPDLGVRAPDMEASSRRMSYGGDAYTGIQNAASDTEQAVVEGVNEIGRISVRLAQAANEADHDRMARLTQAAGLLIISLGVVNFNMTLRRSTSSDQVTWVQHGAPAIDTA